MNELSGGYIISVVVVEILFVKTICIYNPVAFDGVNHDIAFCIIAVYRRLRLEKKCKLLRECHHITILKIISVVIPRGKTMLLQRNKSVFLRTSLWN